MYQLFTLLGLIAVIILVAIALTQISSIDRRLERLEAVLEKLPPGKSASIDNRLLSHLSPQEQAPAPQLSQAHNINEGQQAFERNCFACHRYERGDVMLAPPVFALKDHYKRRYKSDAEIAEAMKRYIRKPDPSIALMPGAIRNFGIMPTLPLPDEDLDKAISFILTTDFNLPEWYDEHFLDEHSNTP